MKIVFCFIILLLVLKTSAMPNAPKDAEDVNDATTPPQSSSHQMGTIVDKDSSVEDSPSTDDNADGEDDKSDDASDTSELLGFNLSLFPASSLFGANAMFQKLQESLRVIRDQLNTLWSLNDDDHASLDMPDNYVNSTSYSKHINGTLVTVNETIYKVTNEDGIQSFYHTKVISVHPENESDTHQKQSIAHQKLPRIDETEMQESENNGKMSHESVLDDSSLTPITD